MPLHPLRAAGAAARAFKATLSAGPNYHGGAYGHDPAYWRDWFRNGWAAVSGALGAFWGALREWGGTDYAALAEDAAANPHAGRGLRLICDNGAAVPVVAYREGDDGAPEPYDGCDALDAIERDGWAALWTAYVWGMYCAGEVFVRRLTPDTGENAGTVRRLQVLRGERFADFERDAAGEVTGYAFTRPDGRGTETFPADEVAHFKTFNPADPDRGLPLLLAARRALTLVAEADAWNRGIAKGGGRVPGYLTPSPQMLEMFGGQIPTDKLREAQDAADRTTMERRASNLPQMLSGAFDFKDGGVSPREADWLKGRQVAMREIAAVLGVPAVLLADEKGGSLTDAGVDSEIAALYKLTIRPLLSRFLADLTRWLCHDGEWLDADWDQVPALQEGIDAKFARYANPDLPLTDKERRVALGYDAEVPAEMADAPEAPDEAERAETVGAAVAERLKAVLYDPDSY